MKRRLRRLLMPALALLSIPRGPACALGGPDPAVATTRPPQAPARDPEASFARWEPGVQTEAPSENPASPALLDRAGFPSHVGLALDQPLGDPDGGRALTLRFTPLALVARAGMGQFHDPETSRALRAFRRVGLSATLGGPTQADDVTRALRPRAVTNHFTADFKLMMIGGPIRPGSEPRSPPRGPVRALSLSLAADTYATGFGRDLYAATCIAESGRPHDLIVNLGVRREERFHDRRKEELKLGAGVNWRCLEAFGRPVNATLGCDELVRNLGRAAVSEASAKCDVPLTDRLRLTTGVTCANRPERYAEGRVRGSIGLGEVFR